MPATLPPPHRRIDVSPSIEDLTLGGVRPGVTELLPRMLTPASIDFDWQRNDQILVATVRYGSTEDPARGRSIQGATVVQGMHTGRIDRISVSDVASHQHISGGIARMADAVKVILNHTLAPQPLSRSVDLVEQALRMASTKVETAFRRLDTETTA